MPPALSWLSASWCSWSWLCSSLRGSDGGLAPTERAGTAPPRRMPPAGCLHGLGPHLAPAFAGGAVVLPPVPHRSAGRADLARLCHLAAGLLCGGGGRCFSPSAPARPPPPPPRAPPRGPPP